MVFFALRAVAVYPRWRGEHIAAAVGVEPWTGLSPLARGTLPGLSPRKRRCRFIPAGAGNTANVNTADPSPAVYPRWRGEHLTSSMVGGMKAGLSPLARGTH